ncbi:hypothetical protein FSY45_24865 [Comamonas sp. Z1]|uniref:hypothetical protein n=1 Tax=Comamonas sp. Z1 TaxID=2601246 RepID=UPI0011E6C546|nr:hypothetical protein [Comamonas sp. Z1]TYK70296.1 hypothetical protein FSY45_24865 [Comamonas sp. Z1]
MATLYEETADLMLTTMAGQYTGLTRDQFIELFKQKFPNEADLRTVIATARQQAETAIAEAQAQLKPGQSIMIGIPVKPTR